MVFQRLPLTVQEWMLNLDSFYSGCLASILSLFALDPTPPESGPCWWTELPPTVYQIQAGLATSHLVMYCCFCSLNLKSFIWTYCLWVGHWRYSAYQYRYHSHFVALFLHYCSLLQVSRTQLNLCCLECNVLSLLWWPFSWAITACWASATLESISDHYLKA